MNSKLRNILQSWLDNAMSTSSFGWSPIDGYKGYEDNSEKEAAKDYEKYLAEAEKAIRQAVGEEMLELMDSQELMELLADIEHERWSSWQKWLYQNGSWNNDGSFTISPEKAQRWQKLTETNYAELDEPTKQYDRDEVTKNLVVIRQKIKQWQGGEGE